MNSIYRGDMFYANLEPGIGSEQYGNRPVLIIQNDVGNKFSPTVIVAAVTSKAGIKPKLPTHYFLKAGTVGLHEPSIVLLEQIRTLDKKRLYNYLGKLDAQQIQGINRALEISMGLSKRSKKMVMCLCPVCANNFLSTNDYILQRINQTQTDKDVCTYCNIRRGFDYAIIPK